MFEAHNSFGHTQTACTFARSLRIHRSSHIVAAMALQPMQPVVPPQPVVLAAPGSPQSSQAGTVTRLTWKKMDHFEMDNTYIWMIFLDIPFVDLVNMMYIYIYILCVRI